MSVWRRLVCWLIGTHDPISVPRKRPARTVEVCRRCGVLLSDDPWDDEQDGPRRSA